MKANPFKNYEDFIVWAKLRLANSIIRDGFQDMDDVLKHVIFTYNTFFVGEDLRPIVHEKEDNV